MSQYKLAVDPGSTIKNKTGSWRTLKPVIDKEKCIGCGTCDRVCPEGVCIKTDKKNTQGKNYYTIDLNFCKGCGICAEECPARAISMEWERK